MAANDLKTVSFRSPSAIRDWLDANHEKSDGIWMRIFKKDSGKKSITYAEALDQALCYGWIDGLKCSHDALSYIQKFTPRRARSLWSKINTQHVERLAKNGHMHEAGFRAVEAAKSDGRWHAAYDSPGNASMPEYFLDALKKNKKAKRFFETLNKTNVYSIAWRLQTATKPETRDKRMLAILAMLERGEKFHP